LFKVYYVGSAEEKTFRAGRHQSKHKVIRAMDSKKKFRVTFQTDPPDAKSANEEARWGKLADVLLRPGASMNDSSSRSKTHRDHERLKEELREALDRHDEGGRWKRAG
jgi:hypothetical protein